MSNTKQLSPAMLRELQSINRYGEPSDPHQWHRAQALWFHARDKVLSALIVRELINGDEGDYKLTDAGRAALANVRQVTPSQQQQRCAAPRRLTCGCCTNGCVCSIHQDIPRGMPAHHCDQHRGMAGAALCAQTWADRHQFAQPTPAQQPQARHYPRNEREALAKLAREAAAASCARMADGTIAFSGCTLPPIEWLFEEPDQSVTVPFNALPAWGA